MYYISYGASFISSTASFRLPWGLQMIPAIVLLACVPFMPRSPRWLAKKDRWEEALTTLASVRSGGDTMNAEVLAEMQEIRERCQYVLCSTLVDLTKISSNVTLDSRNNITPQVGWNSLQDGILSVFMWAYLRMFGLSTLVCLMPTTPPFHDHCHV